MLACLEKSHVKVRHAISIFVDFLVFLINYLEVCSNIEEKKLAHSNPKKLHHFVVLFFGGDEGS